MLQTTSRATVIAVLASLTACAGFPPEPQRAAPQAATPESQQTRRASTFTEQTEPTISIRPISPEQQSATQLLAASIRKTDAPVILTELVKGKRVDEQLRAYSKRAGWDMIWQGPDYMLDQNMTIQGDFEASILYFLNGANEAGARLRAVFYRGNKTVRISEF